MEVNLAPNKIKNNSYLPIGSSDKKKNKKKINKFPTYPLVKMTTNRKQTYIFFGLINVLLNFLYHVYFLCKLNNNFRISHTKSMESPSR